MTIERRQPTDNNDVGMRSIRNACDKLNARKGFLEPFHPYILHFLIDPTIAKVPGLVDEKIFLMNSIVEKS